MIATVQLLVEQPLDVQLPLRQDAESPITTAPSLPSLPDDALREHITWRNFYRHLQIGALPLTLLPCMAVYGLARIPLEPKTMLLALICYVLTTISITAGYHRLFAHKSYESNSILKLVLLCIGAGTAQGSCRWWARGHRAHHRYSDLNKDPYGVHRGFLNAHIGWMLFTPRYRPGRVDMSDLDADSLVRFQHKHYFAMMSVFGFALPVAIAGFGWHDWAGGFFFACCLRMTLAHHATFCVNSVAHYFGESTFDDLRSPRDHFITAILTQGEGYHNFHHEFPNDYRNAIKWYQYDPTRNFIWVCSLLGFAKNLQRTGDAVVRKSMLQMEQKKLDRRKAQVDWPVDQSLPILTLAEVAEQSENRLLMVCNGFVHDADAFVNEHPGGQAFLRFRRGKDITADFEGSVYKHSNAARNQLDMLRVARLETSAI